MQRALLALALTFALSSLGGEVRAQTADPIAHLRTSCTGYSPCFTSIANLQWWLHNVKKPTASSPVVVEIGAGTFDGQFQCFSRSIAGFAATNFSGHVTFKGSGREVSVLRRTTGAQAPVYVGDCEDLHFQDLKLVGGHYGIVWYEGGSSTWTDVDIVAGPHHFPFGWSDGPETPGDCEEHGVHYYYNVKIESLMTGGGPAWGNKGAGFYTACGDNWYFGGEITIRGVASGTYSVDQAAVAVADTTGHFRSFGTVIRSLAAPNTTYNGGLSGSPGLAAVIVGYNIDQGGVESGGTFHAHGGNIVADASVTASSGATAIWMSGSSDFVHTPGNSFVVTPGSSGTAQRLVTNGGNPLSPFFWQASVEPPAGGAANGHDMFVETDCNTASGDCDAAGTGTHLMIFRQQCASSSGASPWFDVVRGKCRNEP